MSSLPFFEFISRFSIKICIIHCSLCKLIMLIDINLFNTCIKHYFLQVGSLHARVHRML
jgi:hypothetical protein